MFITVNNRRLQVKITTVNSTHSGIAMHVHQKRGLSKKVYNVHVGITLWSVMRNEFSHKSLAPYTSLTFIGQLRLASANYLFANNFFLFVCFHSKFTLSFLTRTKESDVTKETMQFYDGTRSIIFLSLFFFF